MIRWFLFSAIVFLAIHCTPQEENLELKDRIMQVLDTVEGDFAVAYYNLQTKDKVLINENEHFHAASTMKTPLLIEAFKRSRDGYFDINDSIVLDNTFYSIVDSSEYHLTPDADGDPELYASIGERIGWRELLQRMITRSSNLATNILIRELDAVSVTQSMRELGAPDIQVLRGVEDIKAYEAGLSNTTTAFDLMMIFEKMALGQIVDSVVSKEMIRILSGQEFADIIPALLPENVTIAHKTGSITGVRHDSGIVFLPDGRKYVLVLLSKNLEDEQKGIHVLARISKIIFEDASKILPSSEAVTNG